MIDYNEALVSKSTINVGYSVGGDTNIEKPRT